MATLTPQSALIYVMTIAAVADGKLKESELGIIGELAGMLPVFAGYSAEALKRAVENCTAMLDQEDGIDAVLGLAKDGLPEHLRETAYALACDVIAVDGRARQEELRWLEMLRDGLGVGRLEAAAIERGARARWHRP